ncbi:RNA-directed DNA polymerase, eukaryota [Tanacetum coccineum]|uniref:RNA-directed DNA polymerase, eukaryota n=1 Tax=Tanacetum coccineum TaxID=301880 RepID=A0ABQ5IQT3_9ASTR
MKGTSKATLCFKRKEVVLEGFSDSDYEGCLDSGKSTTGYVFIVGGTAVSWMSRIQKCVSMSTTEAEYMAIAEAGKELDTLYRKSSSPAFGYCNVFRMFGGTGGDLQISLRGVFVDGIWRSDPVRIKNAFFDHFEARFKKPADQRFKLNFQFHKILLKDQADDLERGVSRDEIRRAVWNFGSDFCEAIEHFFTSGGFSKDRSSGASEILFQTTHLLLLLGRQILDGPFILDEILKWCKRMKKQAMFFKVDFAKAYDSVRWDYLIDVLEAFGFGSVWCNWIRGILYSSKASILVNGSPTKEFSCYRGLKQGDPLAPYLFILVMESLHLSFSRVVEEDLFKGIQLPRSISISHLFLMHDAMFIGEWSDNNLKGITNILKCFFLASGLQINVHKCQLLGVGVPNNVVQQAADSIGCSILNNQFRYLGVMVGDNMSRLKAWDDIILKIKSRLSKWKVKTLSIGGRLTLLKSVLGASPIYAMSIFTVPRGVLKALESIRNRFFNGADQSDNKITWVAWDKVLASKKKGGLGVSSFFALNRALLLKWVWRFMSQDHSLWCQLDKQVSVNLTSFHSMESSFVGMFREGFEQHMLENLTSRWRRIIIELL